MPGYTVGVCGFSFGEVLGFLFCFIRVSQCKSVWPRAYCAAHAALNLWQSSGFVPFVLLSVNTTSECHCSKLWEFICSVLELTL